MKPEKKFISKQDIWNSSTMKPRVVDVPEWGGVVRYRPMTMTERREIRRKASVYIPDPKTGETVMEIDNERMELYSLIYCVLDPEDDNRLLFTPDDITFLETKVAAGAISTVTSAIFAASGLTKEAVKSSDD